MAKFDWKDEQTLCSLIGESRCASDVLRKIGLNPASNAVTLRKYILKYGIDVSHFDGDQCKLERKGKRTPLDELLVENSSYSSRFNLKKRLVNEGRLAYICAECDNTGVWNGKQLTLQLEHKNGDCTDNRITNLEFLCPNCHSQTETFAGRNKQEYNCNH